MRTDRGAVAGLDGMFFGLLVFGIGVLAVVNLWRAVDARRVADATAREYLRAWTEAPSPERAVADADSAARSRVEAAGWPAGSVEIVGADPSIFGPCAPAEVQITVRLRPIHVPLVSSLGPETMTVTRSELIDPYREIEAAPGFDRANTPCG